MILHPGSSGAARHARVGRCSQCKRERVVFERDGTGEIICEGCVVWVVELASALFETDELYEGSTSREWLAVHRLGHHGAVIGCPWCASGMAA